MLLLPLDGGLRWNWSMVGESVLGWTVIIALGMLIAVSAVPGLIASMLVLGAYLVRIRRQVLAWFGGKSGETRYNQL